MKLGIFAINLDSRPDRWESVLNQERQHQWKILRVVATTPAEIMSDGNDFTTKEVQACWNSHMKSMKQFLETEYEYALILEDDFVASHVDLEKLILQIEKSEIDFLQIGYLITSPGMALHQRGFNILDLLLKAITKIRFTFIEKYYKKKITIQEQLGVPVSIVMNDVLPGAHAYIVSRRFAIKILKLNHPVFLATDNFFMALSFMKTFRMGRMRKSKVAQSNSKTSIKSRFISK